jgi:hypothetical protein
VPQHLTSFQLTVLALAFLIHKNQIPDLKEIIRNYDQILTQFKLFKNNPKIFEGQLLDIPKNEQDILCKYKFCGPKELLSLRSKYGSNKENKQRLFDIFIEFLEYYSNNDYKTKISLSKIDRKLIDNVTKNGELYICNPLNPWIDAANGMNYRKLNRFRFALDESISIYKKSESKNLISLLKKVYVPEKVANTIYDVDVPIEDDSNIIENISLKNDQLI